MDYDSESEGKDYSAKGSKKEMDDEGCCPSCGYFVGGASTCPRCGAHTKKRLSVKLIRQIAIIGSLLGVVLVWLAAYHKQPPEVRLSEIDETMNNALIRVEGTVAELDKDGNDFSIVLEQDDHELRLRGFNNLDRFQDVLGDNFPGRYDRVQVTGSLQTSLRFGNSMFLSIPERLQVIEKCDRHPGYLADIRQEDIGRCMVVEGQVVDEREFSVGREITLQSEGVQIPLTIFEWEEENMPPDVVNATRSTGTNLSAFVRVDQYAGDLQLQLVDPEQPDAIEILDDPEALTTGQVSLQHEGQRFQLDALVTGVQSLENGTILTVDDNSGEVELFIWEGNEEKIDRFSALLRPRGARISSPVRVSEFGGQAQLRIDEFDAVEVSVVD